MDLIDSSVDLFAIYNNKNGKPPNSNYEWLSDNKKSKALGWIPNFKQDKEKIINLGMKSEGVPIYSKEIAYLFEEDWMRIIKINSSGEKISMFNFIVNYINGFNQGRDSFLDKYDNEIDKDLNLFQERINYLYHFHDFKIYGYLGAKKILNFSIKVCNPLLFHRIGFVAAYFHQIELLFLKYPSLSRFVLTGNEMDVSNLKKKIKKELEFSNMINQNSSQIKKHIQNYLDEAASPKPMYWIIFLCIALEREILVKLNNVDYVNIINDTFNQTLKKGNLTKFSEFKDKTGWEYNPNHKFDFSFI